MLCGRNTDISYCNCTATSSAGKYKGNQNTKDCCSSVKGGVDKTLNKKEILFSKLGYRNIRLECQRAFPYVTRHATMSYFMRSTCDTDASDLARRQCDNCRGLTVVASPVIARNGVVYKNECCARCSSVDAYRFVNGQVKCPIKSVKCPTKSVKCPTKRSNSKNCSVSIDRKNVQLNEGKRLLQCAPTSSSDNILPYVNHVCRDYTKRKKPVVDSNFKNICVFRDDGKHSKTIYCKRRKKSMGKIVVNTTCNKNEIYDVENNKCTMFRCGAGYKPAAITDSSFNCIRNHFEHCLTYNSPVYLKVNETRPYDNDSFIYSLFSALGVDSDFSITNNGKTRSVHVEIIKTIMKRDLLTFISSTKYYTFPSLPLSTKPSLSPQLSLSPQHIRTNRKINYASSTTLSSIYRLYDMNFTLNFVQSRACIKPLFVDTDKFKLTSNCGVEFHGNVIPSKYISLWLNVSRYNVTRKLAMCRETIFDLNCSLCRLQNVKINNDGSLSGRFMNSRQFRRYEIKEYIPLQDGFAVCRPVDPEANHKHGLPWLLTTFFVVFFSFFFFFFIKTLLE